MNYASKLARRLLGIALALAFCALSAHAQTQEKAPEKISTAPGQHVIVKRVTGAVSEEKVEAKGAGVALQKDGAETVVVYLPPLGVDRLDDKVTFKVGGVAVAPIPVTVSAASAAKGADLTAANLYEPSFKALFILFVLAVLLENALALLFRWQPFLATFNSRNLTPVIAFVVSFIFVATFGLDVVTSLTNIYTQASHPSELPGRLVTAMIVAGGSAGVNRILQTFGFRAIGTPEQQVRSTLREDQGWISVRLVRERSQGVVEVLLDNQAIGQVGTGTEVTGPLRHFLRNPVRFPQSGGYVVEAGKAHKIELKGVDAMGNALPLSVWGPTQVGPRAILDVVIKL